MKSLKLILPGLISASIPTISSMIEDAACSEMNKDYSAALRICNQILAIDPVNGVAYQLRGIVKMRLNDYQNGIDDLHIAQSLLYQSQPS